MMCFARHRGNRSDAERHQPSGSTTASKIATTVSAPTKMRDTSFPMTVNDHLPREISFVETEQGNRQSGDLLDPVTRNREDNTLQLREEETRGHPLVSGSEITGEFLEMKNVLLANERSDGAFPHQGGVNALLAQKSSKNPSRGRKAKIQTCPMLRETGELRR